MLENNGQTMRAHNESNLQKSCVRWFRLQYPKLASLLFAVPNGGARNAITGAILKAEGVTKGVADLLLLVPTKHHHALCVEMKTPKGRQSENQKHWQRAVEAQGYYYAIVRSLDEFVELVRWYLNEPPKARLQGRIKFT